MKIINIKGTIVSNDDKWIYEWFGYDATSPDDIAKELDEAAGDDVVIKINSGGGDVFSGNAIYDLIHSYQGKTTVVITGICASIATVISCAANVVQANPGIQYMIHNVSCAARGDYRDMDHASDTLKVANKAISNVYRLKTGMTNEELLSLMNEETWMDAEKAKKYGFVDEIIGDNGVFDDFNTPITYHNSVAMVLSNEVKQKVRAAFKNPDQGEKDRRMMQQNLTILKLKGEANNV